MSIQNRRSTVLKIGITGSIGSGKTTVVKLFQELGVPVYLSDNKSKNFLSKNRVKKQIVELFGLHLVDINGEIDKGILADIVFNDKDKLNQLENILHPLVREDFENWCQLNSNSDYILYESAIIFEKNLKFDKVITVSAPESLRIKRVMKRNNLTEQAVLNVMKNQMTDEKKVELADFVIINDGEDMIESMISLREQVINIHQILKIYN